MLLSIMAPSPLLYGSSSSSPAGHPGVSGTPEATTIVQKVHDTEMASTTTIAIYSVNTSTQSPPSKSPEISSVGSSIAASFSTSTPRSTGRTIETSTSTYTVTSTGADTTIPSGTSATFDQPTFMTSNPLQSSASTVATVNTTASYETTSDSANTQGTLTSSETALGTSDSNTKETSTVSETTSSSVGIAETSTVSETTSSSVGIAETSTVSETTSSSVGIAETSTVSETTSSSVGIAETTNPVYTTEGKSTFTGSTSDKATKGEEQATSVTSLGSSITVEGTVQPNTTSDRTSSPVLTSSPTLATRNSTVDSFHSERLRLNGKIDDLNSQVDSLTIAVAVITTILVVIILVFLAYKIYRYFHRNDDAASDSMNIETTRISGKGSRKKTYYRPDSAFGFLDKDDTGFGASRSNDASLVTFTGPEQGSSGNEEESGFNSKPGHSVDGIDNRREDGENKKLTLGNPAFGAKEKTTAEADNFTDIDLEQV